MITVFFTPYYKFLQKDNYLKFFNEVESLNDLIAKIKIEDKIKIYAHSKDIIKFQFGNTNPNVEYEFLEDNVLFDEFNVVGNKIKAKVKDTWQKILGEYVYFTQNRDLQLQLVDSTNFCVFQPVDIKELNENILKRGYIGEQLVNKMWLTDEEIEYLATQEGR
jgi:hypothetical protein